MSHSEMARPIVTLTPTKVLYITMLIVKNCELSRRFWCPYLYEEIGEIKTKHKRLKLRYTKIIDIKCNMMMNNLVSP